MSTLDFMPVKGSKKSGLSKERFPVAEMCLIGAVRHGRRDHNLVHIRSVNIRDQRKAA